MADENKVQVVIESKYDDKGIKEFQQDLKNMRKTASQYAHNGFFDPRATVKPPVLKRIDNAQRNAKNALNRSGAARDKSMEAAFDWRDRAGVLMSQWEKFQEQTFGSDWKSYMKKTPVHRSRSGNTVEVSADAKESAKAAKAAEKEAQARAISAQKAEQIADAERRANNLRDAKAGFGAWARGEEESEKQAAEAAKKAADEQKEYEKASLQLNKILSSVAENERKIAEQAEKAAIAKQKQEAKEQAAEAKAIAKAEAEAAKEAEKAAKAAAKEAAERRKLLKSFGSKIKDRLTAPFKNFSDGITRSIAMVKRAFARIILYKGIRQAMSTTFNAFKTGFENLYKYSEAFGTQFKKSMDSLATDALYVKNSLGAMAEPLINRIAPAVDMLTDRFVALLNTINQVIATLAGESSYRKAIKYPTEYAEAAKGAAKANDLWLGSFDEINRMTDSKGGGSAEELDYSKMFEEAPVQGFIQDIIDNNRWASAGAAIANKLNDSIKSIDTYSMGKTLGEKVKGAVDFSLSFLKTFNFSEAGQKIADWFNGAVESVDWYDVGDLMVTGLTSALDFLGGLIGGINEEKVATAISDWLKGAIDSATNWLKDKDWVTATQNAYESVKGFLTNIDWDGIWNSVWELSKTAAIAAFHILSTGIEELVDDMVQIADGKIQELADLFDIDLPPIFTQTWETIKAGFEEFKKFVDECGILQAIKKQFDFNPFDGAFGDFLRWLFPNGGSSGFSGSGRGSNQKNSIPVINRATGGTVDRGQLFIANERGPELVGQVGHQTTVTNQDQFTRGLEDANAPVVQAILSAASAIIENANSKNYTIELDGAKVSKQIYTSMNQEGVRRGTSLAWGQ